MRDQILSYINSLKLKNYSVSQKVPFGSNGVALYLSNPKTIYVDLDQTLIEPYLVLMNKTIMKETTSVNIYLATDAKQLPQDYSSTVSLLEKSRDLVNALNLNASTSNATTDYQNDLLITTIELTFERIIN